jgi:hypothetical protein
MKKIFLILFTLFIIIFCFSWDISVFSSDCGYNWSVMWSLENCIGKTDLVNPGDVKISGWFSNTVKKWTKNISVILAVCAVFWIVYGSFMLTTSQWDSEKAKKAKNIILWSIAWFICMVTAPFIVNLVIKIMYSV